MCNSTKKNLETACKELLKLVLDGKIKNAKELNLAKKELSARYKLDTLVKNADVLALCTKEERKKVIDLLQKKPVRTISGVAVVAVMTSPEQCPHGKCVPCPGGPDSIFKTPQSYMGSEPATRRAIQHNFDPYRQVNFRLNQLKKIGHRIDKVELIIMGGTFTARTKEYQKWFIKNCFDALNKKFFRTLEESQKFNETSEIRNIGITFETRPDWAKKEHINFLLKLGATKVEIGVQSIYDSVLEKINRGHSVQDSIIANKTLRDFGLKVGFHIMPGLPYSDTEMDFQMFKTLFSDQNFKPDYLKIYPTLVTEGTELYEMWKSGEYKELDNEPAVELMAKAKALLPKWVRLQRIQRDIPSNQIIAGVTKSNIRQLAKDRLQELGKTCKCIRCREVGHHLLKGIKPDIENIELLKEKYQCCGGTEYFISFEDTEKDILIGFLRLRIPSNPSNPQRLELINAALVRELHVYGPLVSIGYSAKEFEWQHRHYGRELLREAECLASENGMDNIAITSGIGVREYYRKFGYELKGCYMVKRLY
ncbi:MAG: tRNA uridine(34) 5-carboxymethylaminomethyl modification radical SAM/GNAT enzyme Elp3 [Methanosarcinales archaeon]